jgi:hypothetical protein
LSSLTDMQWTGMMMTTSCEMDSSPSLTNPAQHPKHTGPIWTPQVHPGACTHNTHGIRSATKIAWMASSQPRPPKYGWRFLPTSRTNPDVSPLSRPCRYFTGVKLASKQDIVEKMLDNDALSPFICSIQVCLSSKIWSKFSTDLPKTVADSAQSTLSVHS